MKHIFFFEFFFFFFFLFLISSNFFVTLFRAKLNNMGSKRTKEDLLDIWAKPRNIIVGIDGSKFGDAAIDWAIENLVRENDTLHLVYSYVPLMEYVDVEDGIVFSPTQKEQDKLKDHATGVVHHSIVRALGEEPHVKIEQHILTGDPRMCINDLAERLEASTVVVGCRGRGAVSRALLGSVSTWLSHHCKRPVVIVRVDD
eukprot:m.134934 g.134934  ORF g.134934 m.134934 type:complete len:200 (+) comp9780_c0_seq1:3-602(+)